MIVCLSMSINYALTSTLLRVRTVLSVKIPSPAQGRTCFNVLEQCHFDW